MRRGMAAQHSTRRPCNDKGRLRASSRHSLFNELSFSRRTPRGGSEKGSDFIDGPSIETHPAGTTSFVVTISDCAVSSYCGQPPWAQGG